MLIGGVLILGACAPGANPANTDYFIAPSLDPQSSPLVLETSTPPPASPTPPCNNNMVFLLDVTIPDGTTFKPGEKIEKVWRVRNDGSCPGAEATPFSLRMGLL